MSDKHWTGTVKSLSDISLARGQKFQAIRAMSNTVTEMVDFCRTSMYLTGKGSVKVSMEMSNKHSVGRDTPS